MKDQINNNELTRDDIGLSDSALARGEDLVVLRSGTWRLLVPMRNVERIYDAALPTVVPSVEGARHPVMTVGGVLVPVLFCEALFGGDQVSLDTADKMVLLKSGDRRALLWVDAVEEIVGYAPVSAMPDGPESSDLFTGFSGTERALAVLDVPKLLEFAVADGAQFEAKDSQGANP
jgi:chemotaxis signal transduction protein